MWEIDSKYFSLNFEVFFNRNIFYVSGLFHWFSYCTFIIFALFVCVICVLSDLYNKIVFPKDKHDPIFINQLSNIWGLGTSIIWVQIYLEHNPFASLVSPLVLVSTS